MQGNGKDIPPTRSACIDAETLAAWADGGLSNADAAAVEVHLADCERCTAMLATFARTIPETPAAESLWKRWHLRWLVPVATAATVAALWVLVPRPESPRIATLQSESAQSAQSALPRQAATQPAPQASPAAEPAQPALRNQETSSADAKEREARGAQRQAQTADAFAKREESPSAPQQLADGRQDSANAPKALERSVNESVAVTPPAAPRETDRAEAKAADTQAERFSAPPPAASPAPAAAAPLAGVSAESAARRAVAAPGRGATAIIEVRSPDPMTWWRVVGAGQVERTTNGGARWEAATMPESATLTAGSSPSPSICWLVGRAGAIYVTTDGRRFTRVPFSDRTDFISIQAIDGRRATVVTSDGRRMQTDDQGANWLRVAP